MRSRLAGTQSFGLAHALLTLPVSRGVSYRAALRFTTQQRAETDPARLERGVVFLAPSAGIESLTSLSTRREPAPSRLEVTASLGES